MNGRKVRKAVLGGWIVIALLLLLTVIHAVMPARHGAGTGESGTSQSTIVILVAGTWGNTALWTNIVEGQSTFASELHRAMGSSTDVLPFLWASSTDHAERLAAARNLAKLIDQKSKEYSRICIVGHSHGGNVALLAAGLAHSNVDTVVCLSTPHLELRCQTSAGVELNIPVYCSAASQRNTRSIVNIWPDTDLVPDGWANWQTGISDNEAIELTTELRAKFGQPRLADDGVPVLGAVLGQPQRVFASAQLDNVPAAHQIVVQSYVPDAFGLGAHNVVHSRRMGYVVGKILAADSAEQPMAYTATLVQPPDADDGGAIPDAERQAWCDRNDSAMRFAGWRLNTISLTIQPAARDLAGSIGALEPRSVLQVIRSDPSGNTVLQRTSAAGGYAPAWRTRVVCYPGCTYVLELNLEHILPIFAGPNLGSHEITMPMTGGTPRNDIPPDSSRGVNWGANLRWEAIHY